MWQLHCRFLSKSSDRREQGSRKALFIKSEAASCPVSYPRLSIKVRTELCSLSAVPCKSSIALYSCPRLTVIRGVAACE